MYEYQAKLIEVIDGDTIDVTVDLGFDMRRDIRLRLKGIDTAEIHGVDHDSSEYERGIEQTEFVQAWFTQGQSMYDGEWPFIVETEKRGKFGRYLAVIERKDNKSVLQFAIKENYDNVEY